MDAARIGHRGTTAHVVPQFMQSLLSEKPRNEVHDTLWADLMEEGGHINMKGVVPMPFLLDKSAQHSALISPGKVVKVGLCCSSAYFHTI
jgi:hypothetical protein